MAPPRISFSRAATWVALETFGGAAFNLLGFLLIVTLIGPSDLGISAIALAINQSVTFFPDTLYHDAIIQRRHLSASHAGSAFWSVLILSIILALGVVALAPLAGRLYHEPALCPLLIALSGSSVFTAVASVQTARLRRAMRFRTITIAALWTRALGTAAGLALAIKGYGPWAAVAPFGLGPVILTVIFWSTTGWRFTRHFSLSRTREISVFALGRTAASFVGGMRGRLFFAILGQYLPLQTLGELNLAFRLIDQLTAVILAGIMRLFLPTFARQNGNANAITLSLADANGMTAAFLMPLFSVIALTSGDLVQLVVGPKWQGIEVMIPWLAVAGLAASLEVPASAAVLAVGRPLLMLGSTGAALGLLLLGIFAAAPSDGLQAVICWTLPFLVGLAVTIGITRYAVGVAIRRQVYTFVPAMLMTAAIVAVTVAARHLTHAESLPVRVGVEMATAACSCLASSALFIFVLYPARLRPDTSQRLSAATRGGEMP